MCFAQGHNTLSRVSLELGTLRYKYITTTEPLHSSGLTVKTHKGLKSDSQKETRWYTINSILNNYNCNGVCRLSSPKMGPCFAPLFRRKTREHDIRHSAFSKINEGTCYSTFQSSFPPPSSSRYLVILR